MGFDGLIRFWKQLKTPFLAYFELFWNLFSIAHNPKVVGSSPAPATQ